MLLLIFPLVLVGLKRLRWVVLAVSFACYGLANVFGWNLPTWPDGNWLFNPLAWQVLFVTGAMAGIIHGKPWLGGLRWVLLPLSALYLSLSLFVVLTWHMPSLERYLPDMVQALLYPIDKTNLSPVRLLHFFALAYVVVQAVPGDSPWLRRRAAQPIIRCGQHPLEIFCLSVFSFLCRAYGLDRTERQSGRASRRQSGRHRRDDRRGLLPDLVPHFGGKTAVMTRSGES